MKSPMLKKARLVAILIALPLLTTACPNPNTTEYPSQYSTEPSNERPVDQSPTTEPEFVASIYVYDLTMGLGAPIPNATTSLCDSKTTFDGLTYCPWSFVGDGGDDWVRARDGRVLVAITVEAEGYEPTRVIKRVPADEPPEIQIGLLPSDRIDGLATYHRIEASSPWSEQIHIATGGRIHVEALEGSVGCWGGPGGVYNHEGPDGFVNEYRDSTPVPSAPVCALIGRFDNGPPFFIGSQSDITAPDSSTLYFGVNDSGVGDNTGEFIVRITKPVSDWNLVYNGDFSQESLQWGTQIEGTCDLCRIWVEEQDTERSDYLTWERDPMEDDVIGIWASQSITLDLPECIDLNLSFNVRVNRDDVVRPQNTDLGIPQRYPAQVKIRFLDYQFEGFEWIQGFVLQGQQIAPSSRVVALPQGEWVTYSADILTPELWVDENGQSLPPPAYIDDITVGGSGWDFSAAIDDIQLSGCSNLFP